MNACETCQHREHEGHCGWPIVTYGRFSPPGNPTVIMSTENVDRYCACGLVDSLLPGRRFHGVTDTDSKDEA